MTRPARIRTAQTSQVTVASSATVILATALSDRAGIMVRNTSTVDTLYLGFTQAEAATAAGWPISPGEVWSGDLSPGVSLWGISDGSDIDVRLMQGAG